MIGTRAEVHTGRHARLGPGTRMLAALTGAVLVLSGCGSDQLPWCSELASVADLEELATALRTGDAEGASEGLERFTSVASSAPVEVRADMEAVADALSEAVEVAMTGAGSDPDDLELRREAVNAQLGRVTSNVAAVSAWAEKECGIRLD